MLRKGRAGILANVPGEGRDGEKTTRLLFAETVTRGARRSIASPIPLERTIGSVKNPSGPVAIKIARLPDGSRRIKPQCEACRSNVPERRVPLGNFDCEMELLLEDTDGE